MMLTSEELELISLRPLAAQSDQVTDPSSDPHSNSAAIPTPSSTPALKLEWGPIEHLAYFSCDEARKVTFDLSCLHAFRQPALPANLAWGRKLFLKKNRRNRDVGHPKPLVDLAHACIALGKEEELRSADVVTWRGLLVKLMLGIRIDVKFYNVGGGLYLVEHDPKPRAVHYSQIDSGYHGYAFEAACTRKQDNVASIPTLDVWKCIVRRSFDGLNVVFGAEIDCVDGQYDNTSENLMELKTQLYAGPGVAPITQTNIKKKHWYLQCYLMDIPDICVGYRDEKLILRKVERIPLDTYYKPQDGTLGTAFAFAAQILKELRVFLSSRAAGQGSRAWKVTVQRGTLVNQPQMLQQLAPVY